MYATYGSLTEQSGGATRYQPGPVATGIGDGRGTPVRGSLITPCRREAIDDVMWPLAHDPHAPGTAREIAAALLDDWKVDEEAAEAALLVVSELVTNAVEHAQPPLTVRLNREPDRQQLRAEVSDGGPASAEGAWATTGEADEHGRGMIIIEALTTAHGTHTHLHGTTHWASLPANT